MIPLKIETLYGGGAVERLQEEIQRVIANICDPNTPAKKARKIKLELVVKPNEQRNMAEVVVNTSSTLCPPEPLEPASTSATIPGPAKSPRRRSPAARIPTRISCLM